MQVHPSLNCIVGYGTTTTGRHLEESGRAWPTPSDIEEPGCHPSRLAGVLGHDGQKVLFSEVHQLARSAMTVLLVPADALHVHDCWSLVFVS